MAYEKYNVYLDKVAKTPKEDYHAEMQANVDEVFYNSSDWHTIEEEDDFGSETYCDIDVRVNTVVSTTTGANQGDDWRKFIFKDVTKIVQIGQIYIFADNYWIVVNADIVSGITSSCTVRRCNNTLRWISPSGAKYAVPCVLDYSIQENRDYSSGGSKLVNPSGILEITTQTNSKTNQIQSSKRFLFGNSDNWTAYIVFGGGIHNFNNFTTSDMDSGHLLRLTVGVSYVNPQIDDIVDGYANHEENLYSITLDYSSIAGSISDTPQIVATVIMSGETVTRTVNWTSSDESICTVDSSGIITMIANGSSTVRATLDGDTSIYSECSVTVSATPASGYVIVISPNENFILQEESQSYSFTLENNGVAQVDTFTFAVVAGNVPSDNYVLTVNDGNNITVDNVEKYLDEDLVIRATSGIYTEDLDILLKGYW